MKSSKLLVLAAVAAAVVAVPFAMAQTADKPKADETAPAVATDKAHSEAEQKAKRRAAAAAQEKAQAGQQSAPREEEEEEARRRR